MTIRDPERRSARAMREHVERLNEQARALIHEMLAHGPCAEADLGEEAERLGIQWGRVEAVLHTMRARRRAGVRGRRAQWTLRAPREHEHAYDRVEARYRGARIDLHLACSCGEVDRRPITDHEWTRPGRARAHRRPVTCSCHGISLMTLTHHCGAHDLTAHRITIRHRGGLRLICARCATEDVAARTRAGAITPEASRRAALRYYHEHRKGKPRVRRESAS